MTFSSQDQESSSSEWKRFTDLLWYNDDLGIWLDISKMRISSSELKNLEPKLNNALTAMKSLENGSIANKDEDRQVGHYWLRNLSLSPTNEIKLNIESEINEINSFGKDILQGNICPYSDSTFTDVLWIGIGGSSLGPVLIINALKDFTKGLNFHFLDNIDPLGIENTLDVLDSNLKTTLFVVVSKSGGTLEPRICMDQVKYRLKLKSIDWSKNAVAITMKNSSLYKQALSEKWLKIFDLPDWVGGRTSITSSVGLLPTSLIEADIQSFLRGASSMDTLCKSNIICDNPAALMAASWLVSGNSKGLKDMVVLPYNDRLEVFSRYLQQLVMESLGKKEDRSGNIVKQGISVYGNKGSTDQHAYVQQLRDGLDNFFAIFIEVIKDNTHTLDKSNMNPNDYLSGFLQGTRSALSQEGKESITISLREFNELTLGSLIALFERTVGIYAELIDINAYNQPGVEAGKIAAASIINQQSQLIEIFSDGKVYTLDQLNKKLNNSSLESIYMIIRNLSTNGVIKKVKGEWIDPDSLKLTLS